MSCLQISDSVDFGKRYRMDYDILCIKPEVERISLLTWGRAIGLNNFEKGRFAGDARLRQPEVNAIALRFLGAIEYIFQNSKKLQKSYGLRWF